MAQYPIKLMKDESGQPFVPLTSIKAVVGEEYIQTALLAEQVSTGHFVITNDKITDSDILNKIVAVSFPDEITATTNSYLKINEENEYLIYDEDGTGPLLIKDFAHVICFLMRKEDRWQLVKTGAAATAASGGHTIIDNDGNVMPQQKVLQFKGFGVSDNAGTGATVISTPALVNNLSTTESGTGPLDAYQGKVLNDKFDNYALSSSLDNYSLKTDLNNYLPLSGGTMTGTINLGQGDGACLQLGTNGRINAAGDNHTILGLIDSKVYVGHSDYNMVLRAASAEIPKLNITHNGNYSSGGNDYTLRLSTTAGVHLDLGYDGLQCKKADNTPNKMYLQYTGGGVQFGRTENACNLDLYGAVNFKNSGTIINYNDTTGSTLMKIGSSNKRTNIIRVYSSDQTYAETACYGFTMAYSGDGSGTGNKLIFFADNQNSATQVEALAIANDGVINFGKTVTKQGSNVPAVFIASSAPTAKQTGDIWFVT